MHADAYSKARGLLLERTRKWIQREADGSNALSRSLETRRMPSAVSIGTQTLYRERVVCRRVLLKDPPVEWSLKQLR